jgi:hypothetical protein
MVPKMWSGVPPEDLLTPEPALPAQFNEVWHRSRAITPEKALLLSVLWQAILDLRKHRFARRRRYQRLYMEAYKWVGSDDRSWPYSFVNICEALSLTPEGVRHELLGEMAPPPGWVFEEPPIPGETEAGEEQEVGVEEAA